MTTPSTPYIPRVAPAILRAVVKLRRQPTPTLPDCVGTGFLVSVHAPEPQLFVVTNKHMISDWTLADANIQQYAPAIDVTLYGGPGGAFTPVTVALTDPSGQPFAQRLRVASAGVVDVAAIRLNEPARPPFTHAAFEPSFFLRFAQIPVHQTGLGDQVYAIGYPMGITSLTTSYPIAKSGYIASIPGDTFSMDVPTITRSGVPVQRRLEGSILVVDGLIVPGNSGGPVVIPHELKLRRDSSTNQLEFGSIQLQNWIVGIVSTGLGPSGLTLVYASDYVLDLVGEFAQGLSPG